MTLQFCKQPTYDLHQIDKKVDNYVSMVSDLDTFSVLSWPHFLHAEEKYQNAVEGLNPDPESHGFWFDIQQVTGTTLSAKVCKLKTFLLFNVVIPPGKDPDQHECEEDGDV